MRLREVIANWFGYRVMKLDVLTQLMNAAGSDKGLGVYGRHYYTRIYRTLFEPIRNLPITFVEIGLLRPDRDRRRATNSFVREKGKPPASGCASAPSLEAWRRYFPNAKIIGFDIDDFSEVNLPGVKILQGDMSEPHDLRAIMSAANGPIDVVIDDGSHLSHHQQIAFSELFSQVAPGGLYIVEDCHWQDESNELREAVKTREVFASFRRSGKIQSPFMDQTTADILSSQIESVAMHDSVEVGIADTEDALCVIRKKRT
jgi:hypothetical protein